MVISSNHFYHPQTLEGINELSINAFFIDSVASSCEREYAPKLEMLKKLDLLVLYEMILTREDYQKYPSIEQLG